MGYRVITTVLEAASSKNLATLADVKAELSITGGQEDSLLNRYIASASVAVGQYCNRVFAAETVKDEIWPDREWYSFQVAGSMHDVHLSRWPVITMTTVVENGKTLTDPAYYRVNQETGIVTRMDQNSYPRDWLAWPLSFTYRAGYETLPPDVVDATIRLVKARYVAKGRDPFLKSETIPGVREATWWVATGTDAGNMPPDVADLLENYRQPVVQ